MNKNILLFIAFIIFLINILSLFLILNFIDPIESSQGTKVIALTSLIVTFILSISSISTIIFFFIKKIYYRGEVFNYHIYTSLRQGFLLSIFSIWAVYLYHLNSFDFKTWGLLAIAIIFTELLIQNLED